MSDAYAAIVARRAAEGRPQTLTELRAALVAVTPTPERAVIVTRAGADAVTGRAPQDIWRTLARQMSEKDRAFVLAQAGANWDADGTGIVVLDPRRLKALRRIARRLKVPVRVRRETAH